ncbi:MAG: trypsin-like peptidase domain-containing protein [Holosporaceae bacterium]|jgi:serine protease Do|nr:trypsin-like peptidase domain-containing protein [Holosporaceae bacterium]
MISFRLLAAIILLFYAETRCVPSINKLMETVVEVIASEKSVSDEYMGKKDSSDGIGKESSDGAGFIIDKKGYIVTNCHVINSSEKIRIVLSNGNEYFAKIIGKDERSDIALLKIDAKTDLPFVRFADSDKIEVADQVIAIGNPFGFKKTVTSGIISYKGRDLSDKISELGVGGDSVLYLQTDVTVNYGNSGGPLFLYNSGEVVGMITVFFSEDGRSIGINFAIPSNTLKTVISQLRNYGKMRRSWTGMSVSQLDSEVSSALGLTEEQGLGVAITRVEKDSPASLAGIQVSDILLSINEEKITNNTNLEYMLSNLPIDKVVPVQILRQKVTMKLSLKVGSRSDDDFSYGFSEDVHIRKDIPYEKIDGINIGVTDLTIDLRKSFEIQDTMNGVLISNLADYKGPDISIGGVILTINQKPVPSVNELKVELQKISASEDAKKRDKVAFFIFDPKIRRYDYVAIPLKSKSANKKDPPDSKKPKKSD